VEHALFFLERSGGEIERVNTSVFLEARDDVKEKKRKRGPEEDRERRELNTKGTL